MSGIGIAERAKLLVVAGDKRRAGAHPAAGFDDAAIDAVVKLGHGIGFVEVGARKEFCSSGAEDFLGRAQDAAIVSAPASNIEQPKQNPLRAYADRIIEVSGDA